MKMNELLKEDFDDIDDLGLGNVGKELDVDDTGGKGFDNDPMFDQLGKILDTQSGADPVRTVKTDDGKEIEVSPQQARMLRMMLNSENIKPAPKLRFTKDIQKSGTLHDFVDVKDYHEMPKIFMQKYM